MRVICRSYFSYTMIDPECGLASLVAFTVQYFILEEVTKVLGDAFLLFVYRLRYRPCAGSYAGCEVLLYSEHDSLKNNEQHTAYLEHMVAYWCTVQSAYPILIDGHEAT